MTKDEILEAFYEGRLDDPLEAVLPEKGVIWVTARPTEEWGIPHLEFWLEDGEDLNTFTVPLSDLGGFEAKMFGPMFSRKCADVFDELAKKARASADEWDAT